MADTNIELYIDTAKAVVEYIPSSLIVFYEKIVRFNESASIIIKTYEAKNIIPDISSSSRIEHFIALALYIGESSAASFDDSIKIYYAKAKEVKNNWFRPIKAEYDLLHNVPGVKIGPRNKHNLEELASQKVFGDIFRGDDTEKDKDYYIEEIFGNIREWRANRDDLIISFPFIRVKSTKTKANAFFTDLILRSLICVRDNLGGQITGLNYRVPNKIVDYPFFSYRSKTIPFDIDFLHGEISIANKYDYLDDYDNPAEVKMQYSPEGKMLPAASSLKGLSSEEINKKLRKKYDIDLKLKELDGTENDIIIRIFSMLSGAVLKDRLVTTNLSSFIKSVYNVERLRSRDYEDFRNRMIKLRNYDYTITVRDKETGRIIETTSMGLLEYFSISVEEDIFSFTPSQRLLDQYIQRSFFNISKQKYRLINNRQTKLIYTLLESIRVTESGNVPLNKIIPLKYFRSHLKLYDMRPKILIQELSKHLDYMIKIKVCVDKYSIVNKNTALDITFLPLDENEKATYKIGTTNKNFIPNTLTQQGDN